MLLVDDEPAITAGFAAVLRHSPYRVHVAHSAEEALLLLASTAIDVVVSDLDMPVMGGADFLARVRHLHPHVMRIVLSGRAKLEDTIHVINDAAVFRFLVKPCDPREFSECIEHAVAAHEPEPLSESSAAMMAFNRALDSLWIATQPVVSARERRTIAYEALVRSREPGFPHGGAIMEAAEKLGRVRDIERRIRRAAADVAARLPEGTFLLVNLHPSALDDPDLVSPDSPLAAHAPRVAFEITERARLKAEGPAWEAIRTLRERGHRIVVDDLGAGYAGLTSLVNLQPDIVKLDMELIREIDKSPTRRKLVSSLVALAKQLEVSVVAEGVESHAEYMHLVELGCDWLQGYFFARPGEPFPTVKWPGATETECADDAA